MPALTKDQIAKAIAENVGLQRNRSIELVEVLIGLVKDSLITGEDVLISGFGKVQCQIQAGTARAESCNW